MIEPMELGFLAVIHYESTYGKAEYKDTVYNGTVNIGAVQEEAFTGESLPLMIGIIAVLSFVAYNYLKQSKLFSSITAATRPKKEKTASSPSVEKGTSEIDNSWLSGTAAAGYKNKSTRKTK